jgi:hypothetical protein
MSKVANTYWVDERIRAQRVAPRSGGSLASVQQISIDIIGTRTEVRRRGGLVSLLGSFRHDFIGYSCGLRHREHADAREFQVAATAILRNAKLMWKHFAI